MLTVEDIDLDVDLMIEKDDGTDPEFEKDNVRWVKDYDDDANFDIEFKKKTDAINLEMTLEDNAF